MLYQFQLTWDEISSMAAATSLTEITITKAINLYGGPYKARVVGFTWMDNLANGVAASNQDLIYIASSKFNFQAFASQGMVFTNRTEHEHPGMKGCYEFYIDNLAGQIDLRVSVKQFLDNRSVDVTATWNTTGLIAMVLSLDIEKLPDERKQEK